jgi:hypothetical protein
MVNRCKKKDSINSRWALLKSHGILIKPPQGYVNLLKNSYMFRILRL